MQIQVQDFPSDIHGESYGLRAEMTKCLQRASVSSTGAEVLRNVLKFSIGKLKEADAIREGDAKPAAKAKAASEPAK